MSTIEDKNEIIQKLLGLRDKLHRNEQTKDPQISFSKTKHSYTEMKSDNVNPSFVENFSYIQYNSYNPKERANLMRQQKHQMLIETLRIEENFSFTPEILSKYKPDIIDDRPAHERLYQKGLDYRENLQREIEKRNNFDDEGNILFQPRIAMSPKRSIPGTSPTSNRKHITMNSSSKKKINPIKIDESLYQKAKEQEQRLLKLCETAMIQTNNLMSSKKMNSKSYDLLRKKSERFVRVLFSAIDEKETNNISYGNLHYFVDIIVNALKERVFQRPKDVTPEACHKFMADSFKTAELIWDALDTNKNGKVDYAQFSKICIPLATRSSTKDEPNDPFYPTLNRNCKVLKSFLSITQEYFSKRGISLEPKDNDNDKTFIPFVNPKSEKLATVNRFRQRQEILDQLQNSSTTDGHISIDVPETLAVHDMLYYHGVAVEQRKHLERTKKMQEELAACSFKPQIKPFKSSSRFSGSNLIEVRGSSLASDSYEEESNLDDRANAEKDSDAQECTFQPNIKQLPKFYARTSRLNRKSPAASHSYELLHVERMRYITPRHTQESERENASPSERDKYKLPNSTRITKNPFIRKSVGFNHNLIIHSSASDFENSAAADYKKTTVLQPKLVIDVNLGGQIGIVQIPVYENDDPTTVVHDFVMKHDLEQNMDPTIINLLIAVVYDNMMKHNIRTSDLENIESF